jgi:hypothetical protein
MILIAAWAITLGLGATLVAGFVCSLKEPSGRPKLVFSGLLLVGLAAAGWGAFFVEYKASPTLRFIGAPVPVAVAHLENGNWVPFDAGPGLPMDFIIVPSLVAMPASAALIARGRRRRRAEQRSRVGLCPACGYDLRASAGRCPECGRVPANA